MATRSHHKPHHPPPPPVEVDVEDAAVETPAAVTKPEPSPAAKAAHCAKCDARFVPTDGAVVCDTCRAAETKRRVAAAGYTLCRVVGIVDAVGRMEDGHFRTRFEDGEVAEFSDEDVLSLPGSFEPVK